MTEELPKSVRVRHRRLPLIIGAVALLIYALTLNHGVSLRGLPLVAHMTGWTWQPKATQPLLSLAYLPLRLLPAASLPVILNLCSALTASLTLMVLARSVQLLPLNRLRIQRMFVRNSQGLFVRDDAWVPVVMAAVAAGLELGFWQEATSASGEMLDVLLVAAGGWCLLEYQYSNAERWLERAAVVWGAGMAENWTMQLYLPLFLGAVVWLRGISRFEFTFLCRVIWLCAGAFFALLLLALGGNLWWQVHDGSGVALAESLSAVSQWLFPAHIEFWVRHPLFTLLVLLYFLLAALPMTLHLKRERSYHTSLQARIQLLIFEYLYGVCLFTGLWLDLQPNGGPAAMIARAYGSFTPLLGLFYINAIGVGYYTAHFLLIFGADWESIRRHDPRFRKPPYLPEQLRYVLPPLLRLLPLFWLIVLAVRNFPTVTEVNRTPLDQYGKLAATTLPAGGGILLSEDIQRLWVLQAALAQRPDADRWLTVNLAWLPRPEYRDALERHWPLGWTQTNVNRLLTEPQLTELLGRLAATNRLYYLHPSFGQAWDGLQAEPHGLVFRLTRKAAAGSQPEPGSAAILAENVKFWEQTAAADLPAVAAYATTLPDQSGPLRAEQLPALAPVRSLPSQLVACWYSVALDDWGAWLMAAGRPVEARQQFTTAVALYPRNPAAASHLAGRTNLAGLELNIPLEMGAADDYAKSMPGRMNDNFIGQEIDNALSIPRDHP